MVKRNAPPLIPVLTVEAQMRGARVVRFGAAPQGEVRVVDATPPRRPEMLQFTARQLLRLEQGRCQLGDMLVNDFNLEESVELDAQAIELQLDFLTWVHGIQEGNGPRVVAVPTAARGLITWEVAAYG